MQRKEITPPKKITSEMLEKGSTILSRDIFNGISSYIDADANNDFNQLNGLCEKFENEHNGALSNLDVSIVNLINAVQNRTQTVEQYNITLQSIHESFKNYLATRITSVPKFNDNEQQIQLIINELDKTTGQSTNVQDSQEIIDTFREVLISRREFANRIKNLHVSASNWLVRNAESAKNIWDNINEFNELIDKGLASNNLVIKRRQELQEILVKLNSRLDVPNPSQEESKDQDPSPPPYSEVIKPYYPAFPYAPAQYDGIPGGLNPGMPQQEYEEVEGIPLPSAPPLDVKIIQVESKAQTSSQLVLSRLNNPQAPVSVASNASSENNGVDDRAKKEFNTINIYLAQKLSSIYSRISKTTDKAHSDMLKQHAAALTKILQELESVVLSNAYYTHIFAIGKKLREFNAPEKDNAIKNVILKELLRMVATLKADVLHLQQKTEKSSLSAINTTSPVTSLANKQPNINEVGQRHDGLLSSRVLLAQSSLKPVHPGEVKEVVIDERIRRSMMPIEERLKLRIKLPDQPVPVFIPKHRQKKDKEPSVDKGNRAGCCTIM